MSGTHTSVPAVAGVPARSPALPTDNRRYPATDALRRVGDKWTMLVIVLLGNGTGRFDELHRDIDGISERMLTRTLRGLVVDGLVDREVVATVPPSFEYGLTPLGRSLLEPLTALVDWAVEHYDDIEAARRMVAWPPEPMGQDPTHD